MGRSKHAISNGFLMTSIICPKKLSDVLAMRRRPPLPPETHKQDVKPVLKQRADGAEQPLQCHPWPGQARPPHRLNHAENQWLSMEPTTPLMNRREG